MDIFIDLLRRSVLGQLILVTLFAGTVCALLLLGRPVPDDLWKLLWVVVAFYFGSKVENAKLRRL